MGTGRSIKIHKFDDGINQSFIQDIKTTNSFLYCPSVYVLCDDIILL